MSASTESFFASSRLTLAVVLVLLFGFGLAIRLYDLTDLPLDFHPTRQLLSGLKARGMYYQATRGLPDWQRKMAIQQWKTKAEVEPEVFERLVAWTYRFTGVQLWVARVYSSFFWVLGGAFLFLLVRDLVSQDAAVISTAYFLFLPYAVIASRSFQPDILMVMLILCSWWTAMKWARSESWAWALLTGVVAGLAIYVKFVAAFFVIAAVLGVGLAWLGRGMFRKSQIWVMAVLGVLPAGIYIYQGVVLQGFLGRQFGGRFIPALLLSPLNYVQWASQADLAAGGIAIMLGLLGILVTRDAKLGRVLIALWSAYILFGLFFDYHVATHDYYHLPLIAIAAFSLSPVADLLSTQIGRATSRPWLRLAALVVAAYGLLSVVWDAREQLSSVDYRPQAAMWAQLGDLLGHGPNVVALTQDYGSRLAYWGWQNAIIWPNSGDRDYHEARGASIGFAELFDKLTVGNAFFLVTDFAELSRQPELKDRLTQYSVYAQGDGYIIYDLQSSRTP